MRAAIINAPHQMQVGAWETPMPGAGEVLVSVEAAGVCAGDMYIYLGKNPYASYPQIGGHEIAGVVSEVGEGVEGLDRGMPVVVEPFIGCGTCYPCRIGKTNCCAQLSIIGVHRAGGFAEFVLAPARNVHRVPPGLSLPFASFAEPVAIGVQACRRGEISAGELVLVVGAGPIGLAVTEVARARGAHVIATDIMPSRLETARSLGAETLPAGEGLLTAVMEHTDGEGAPVVVEATGNTKAMEQTVDLVAAGGRIVILGLARQGDKVSFPALDWTRKEMTVVGSRASVNCFPESLQLLADGKITYPRVASEFPMWTAPDVFAQLASKLESVHKAVLVRDA
ncbi:MAG: zinc-binding alcohol dehydrogenase family protein [Chloroflexota bacterium]|nr:zinc-binding alcohol dehydrogenase family protein [Chloroflexota bacterium]